MFPRYDYSMSLAPEGREGLFTALASAPLFAAKLPTGAGHARCACTQSMRSVLPAACEVQPWFR